jgi:hypothetical protein
MLVDVLLGVNVTLLVTAPSNVTKPLKPLVLVGGVTVNVRSDVGAVVSVIACANEHLI